MTWRWTAAVSVTGTPSAVVTSCGGRRDLHRRRAVIDDAGHCQQRVDDLEVDRGGQCDRDPVGRRHLVRRQAQDGAAYVDADQPVEAEREDEVKAGAEQ